LLARALWSPRSIDVAAIRSSRSGPLSTSRSPDTPSVDREDASRNVAHPTLSPWGPPVGLHLHGVALVVVVVDRADLTGRELPGARVPDVPAARVVPDDDFRTPALPAVLTDNRPDARRIEAAAVDEDQPAVAHEHRLARGAEVGRPRKELPGAAAVVARVDLRPLRGGPVAVAPQPASRAWGCVHWGAGEARERRSRHSSRRYGKGTALGYMGGGPPRRAGATKERKWKAVPASVLQSTSGRLVAGAAWKPGAVP